MEILPFGAAGEVTGSLHLVVAEGRRLLLDAGLYQGQGEERNHDPFPFDPKALEAVILSHAHLDHVGRLPKLFRDGYQGPVYATRATGLLMRIVLEDALKVMEDPPFERRHLEEAMEAFRPLEYGHWLRLGGVGVSLGQAGHLPGSAFVVVQAEGRVLVYSGDLGNRAKAILPDFSLPPKAHLVVSEGTYGDRPHRSYAETVEEFVGILQRTLGQGGKVFIPSFAVERAQEILFVLKENAHRLPRVPIYLDSPMATRVLGLYPRLIAYLSPGVQRRFLAGENPFHPPGLRLVENPEMSRKLAQTQAPMVVIAGSGMLTGGRILLLLKEGLPHPQNALVFVGYQPQGGLGGRIITGVSPVRILGEEVPVRAQVHTLGGFSGHTGQDDLLHWLEGQDRVVLVHGEVGRLEALAQALRARGQRAGLARYGEAVRV